MVLFRIIIFGTASFTSWRLPTNLPSDTSRNKASARISSWPSPYIKATSRTMKVQPWWAASLTRRSCTRSSVPLFENRRKSWRNWSKESKLRFAKYTPVWLASGKVCEKYRLRVSRVSSRPVGFHRLSVLAAAAGQTGVRPMTRTSSTTPSKPF